jgi:2,5-diamino-6-(ribosylamino)-4(3H)-pyrimidinone 5'-phosphate reductase
MIARIPVNGLDGAWKAVKIEEQPRPVILDPHRRAHLPKLLHLVSANEAKSPWILCRKESAVEDDLHIALETENGRFSWTQIFSALAIRGVKSVMIEGGASVLNDVLSQRVADVLIITIAPVFIGKDGVGILPALSTEWLHDVNSIAMGRDIVIAGRIKR